MKFLSDDESSDDDTNHSQSKLISCIKNDNMQIPNA